MPEWWTYRLSDLLLFSPRTYYRMFELYHAGIWPVHLIVLASIAAIMVLARREEAWARSTIAGLLAAWWVWVGIAFHLNRYAPINWAATYFAALFVIQGILLVWYGVVLGKLRFDGSRAVADRTAFGLIVVGVLYPLLGRVAGREWNQVELLGMTPDPTAVGTLALLAFSGPTSPRPLLVIPVAWCMIGAATLWALGSPEAWVLILSGLGAAIPAIRKSRIFTRQ
jgi:hypothetical protein